MTKEMSGDLYLFDIYGSIDRIGFGIFSLFTKFLRIFCVTMTSLVFYPRDLLYFSKISSTCIFFFNILFLFNDET